MARQLLYVFLTLALFHLLSAAPSDILKLTFLFHNWANNIHRILVQFVKDSLTLDLTARDGDEIREWIVETQKDRILLLKIQSESGEQLDREVIKSILTVSIPYMWNKESNTIFNYCYIRSLRSVMKEFLPSSRKVNRRRQPSFQSIRQETLCWSALITTTWTNFS